MLKIGFASRFIFCKLFSLFARYYLNTLVWRVSVSRVFASTNFVIGAMFIFPTRESFAKIGDAATFAVLAILALVMIDTVIVIRALNLLALVGPLRKYYIVSKVCKHDQNYRFFMLTDNGIGHRRLFRSEHLFDILELRTHWQYRDNDRLYND